MQLCMEVVPFLKKMWKRRRFWDVVYFDPPYDSNYDEALKYFSRGATVNPGGLLVIEQIAQHGAARLFIGIETDELHHPVIRVEAFGGEGAADRLGAAIPLRQVCPCGLLRGVIVHEGEAIICAVSMRSCR